jgi:hypothetical protein
MKVNAIKASAVVLLTLLLIAQAPAQEAVGQPREIPTTQPAAEPLPRQPVPVAMRNLPPIAIDTLMPPKRPSRKVAKPLSDQTLSRGGQGHQLQAIAPKNGGLTSSARPTLYFHLSEPVLGEVVATLTKGQEPEPVKEWKLSDLAAGIHALEMTDTDPALEIDAKYTWVVQVRKYDSASKNPSVQTNVVRIERTPQVVGLSPADRVTLLANEGLYYDAVDELLKDPSAQPGAERASNYRGEFRQALELQRTSRHAPTTSLR